MPVELSIEGHGLKELQRKLKAIDAKELRKELNRELKREAQELIPAARDAARDNLPSTGGLGERVASRPMRISVLSSGKVRVMVKGVDATSTNRGRLRHPVFGNRQVWVTQQINPGWFTERMRNESPEVRRALVRAMDRIAEKIAKA